MADNPVLIRHDGEGFRVWHISQLYTIGKDQGHVPNKDDMVVDYTQGFLRVVAVNRDAGVSTLEPWSPTPVNPNTGVDVLIGDGPGTVSEQFRVFINDAVVPHALAVDGSLYIRGDKADYVKIFRGTDVSARGEVISMVFDSAHNFLGENVPLELCDMPNGVNYANKTVQPCYTNTKLVDGEIVSVVAYSADNQPLYVNHLTAKNSAFIRTTDASMKYIVDVSLESPFLSDTDPTKLVYPINMPVENLNMMGVVTYSDGSKSRLPIDGTKFSMYGLENFIATIESMNVDLVLTYHLGQDEYNYISEPTASRTISKLYSATTGKFDGAFSVKLFGYPEWVNDQVGYRMAYRLYNGDREDFYEVTNLVQPTSDSRSFDPTLYGVTQHIGVAINLRNVDSRFPNYRHVQAFDITLRARGDDASQDNWTVGFSPNQNPPYGVGVVARSRFINTGNWQLDLSSGCSTLEEWLNLVYYRISMKFGIGVEDSLEEHIGLSLLFFIPR